MPDLVAGLEEPALRSGRGHHAGGVVAEDPRRAAFAGGALALLGVDGVDRHRLDLDEEIAPAWRRLLDLEIEKRLRVVDRQRAVISDGFHPASPLGLSACALDER